MWWVEPLFGEAKDWHGMRRFRLRMLEKVNAEALLSSPQDRTSRRGCSPTATEARSDRGTGGAALRRRPAPNPYDSRGARRHRNGRSRRPTRVFQHPGGLAAVVATAIGAVGAVGFMRSWANMQGITLISTLVAILLVIGLAWFVTRRARAELPRQQYRRVFRRSLFRLSAWALAGYMAYMVIVTAILSLVGFDYLRGS